MEPPVTASISRRVISESELRSRLDQARMDILAAGGAAPADRNSEAALQNRIRAVEHDIGHVRPVEPTVHPGRRGRVVARAKRAVRRVLYWYVEPSWHTQERVDRRLLELIEHSAATIAELSRRVDQLQVQVDHAAASRADLNHRAAAQRHEPLPNGDPTARSNHPSPRD